MEVTALKESSEDVRHFADRFFHHAWRPLSPRSDVSNLGYDDAPPEGTIDDRDGMVTCPFRVQTV
jgi:hypothetical protein